MNHFDTSQAIADYHRLLEAQPEMASASAASLCAAQGPARLTFGGTPLCAVLRPQFLTPATYARIQSVCALLARAMFRLAGDMLADPRLLEPLALTDAEMDLVGVDPGYREVSPSTRLDSFMASDSWKFVEYNAESPAAIAYEDGLTAVFLDLPIMQAFTAGYHLTPLPARRHLRHVLLDSYHQWGGRDDPMIAIVDWEGVPTASEFELVAEYLREARLRVVIADPRALSYDGNRLWADNQPVDLVYRRVLTSELLARPEAATALVRAYKDHAACVVNSFRAKLLHKKMLFALLSDERYAHHFTAPEQAAIAAHVPWTRQVTEGSTTYAGEHIDLVPFILDNRDKLVLKPNDEYGGRGVVIGWETTTDEWQSALAEALAAPFVVQERVPVERTSFPLWEDGHLAWMDLAVDLDPFLFGSNVGGVLTRLSAESLLNVTAGGASTVPAFLVEPRTHGDGGPSS